MASLSLAQMKKSRIAFGFGFGLGVGNGPSRNNQSNSPAKDSTIKGAPAPGNADSKRLANKGGWGALPPKEQAAAKQHADENYPPHYNKIIEEYNKRMAERKRQ